MYPCYFKFGGWLRNSYSKVISYVFKVRLLFYDLYNFSLPESTQIESAILELELFNADAAAAEHARVILANKLAALGARVPVATSHERSAARLRVALPGPSAVDVLYHIENMVSSFSTTRFYFSSYLFFHNVL